MKKVIALIFILIILSIIIVPITAAGNASFTLSSSASTIRVGNTITITGTINASLMIATFDLNVTYNAGQLSFVSIEGIAPTISSSDDFSYVASAGNIHIIYLDGDGGASGITSGKAFRIVFTVIGGNVGSAVNVGLSLTDVIDSNEADISASGSGTSMTLAAPLSTNNFLSSLSVSGGSLSPGFAKSTTSYSMSVPYEVAKINVNATAEDPTASVSISSPDLTVAGTTAVTVTVTAASGAKKTYTINVSRAQDPNYVPSSNNALAGLTVDGFLLSPVFDPARTEYIIYLPFEIEQVTVTGTPADPKATVAATGNSAFVAGQPNAIKVDCTAEDGTVKTYTILAIRPLAFTGIADYNLPTPTPAITPTPTPTPGAIVPASASTSPLTLILLIVFIVIALAEAGYIVFMLRKSQPKKPNSVS